MPHAMTERISVAERDAEIVRLKREGWTFQKIGEHFGIDRSTVHGHFYRTLQRIAEPEVEKFRAEQVARMELAREIVMDILSVRHIAISNGTVLHDIEDDNPILQAVDRLIKIDEHEAKLLGLYARPEVMISGQLSYVITGLPAPGYDPPALDDNAPPAILA